MSSPVVTRLTHLIVAPLFIALLSACGSGDGDKPAAATQVAAKVNKDEVSVHQINTALSRTPGVTEANSKAAGQQVLERLIDQQLLVQKALEAKLDRDPKVMQAIENAKRQLLAQAYMEQVAASHAVKPAPSDIAAFYAQRPELFKERKIYRLNELIVAVDAANLDAFKAEMAKAKSLNDLTAWAKARNIRYTANSAVKPAEQLPLDYLGRLGKMSDGQMMMVTPPQGGAIVVQVAAAQSAPLTEAQAQPFITQYLMNQKRSETAATELKGLRESAKIEYLGSYAKTASGSPAADAKAVAPAPAPAPAPATSTPPAEGASPGYLDQGLKGLR